MESLHFSPTEVIDGVVDSDSEWVFNRELCKWLLCKQIFIQFWILNIWVWMVKGEGWVVVKGGGKWWNSSIIFFGLL